MRVIRGMLGMGLTFSLGVGAIAGVVAGLAWLIPGLGVGVEVFRLAVASAIWAFPMGVAFSGVLALSRSRSFETLSMPRFAALGAGAGLLLYLPLAINAWDAWSWETAMVNATIFVFLGAGSATASLALARRAGPALESDADAPLLEEGPPPGGRTS
ncbi:MAG: hypothetical protein RH859_01990 [Longimicrobiales bacterium]